MLSYILGWVSLSAMRVSISLSRKVSGWELEGGWSVKLYFYLEWVGFK